MDWLKGQTVKKNKIKKNQTKKGNKGELKRKGRKKRKGTKRTNLGNQLLMGFGNGNQWKPTKGCVSVERY